MTINDLKKSIEDHSVDNSFKIFVLEDYSSDFIAWQYIKAIAKQKRLEVKYIDSFNEISDNGFTSCGYLYIYKTDKLEAFEKKDNLIIICKKTKYPDCIRIPKIENWQFVDYLKGKLPGMSEADLEWLMTQYEQTYDREKTINFFRLDNDLDKVAIFPESAQNNIFNMLYESGEYNTISNLTIFDLTSALVKKDVKTILQVLKVYDYIDSQPHVWLLSILLNNFRNIIGIQLNPKSTTDELGISDKQYYVIKKYNIGYYSKEQLIRIYELLTKAEYLYKFGGLPMNILSDYLICQILGEE